MPSLAILSNELAAPGTPAGAQTTNSAGQPTRRFVKELARVGRYVKNGDTFDLTGEMLDTCVASFGRMKTAGVKVPVPAGHSEKPEDNRGWTEEMYREGDSLMGVVEAVGADAILMASRNDCSVQIKRDFVDGKGNRYPLAIDHVAMTPVPVIPGMGDFVTIAASRDGADPVKVPLYRLARENKQMDLGKIALAMGCPAADLTAENATDKITAHFDKLKADAKALSREAPPVHPQIVTLSAENRQSKIDRLLHAGNITKATADDLGAAFIGQDHATIKLDMTEGGQGNGLFDKVVAALSKNSAIELGERVKNGKVLALSRTVPDAGSTPESQQKVTNEMLAMTPGRPK